MGVVIQGQCLFSKRRQTGFTLIELLVVLVVMGIALALVVPQLMPDDRSILNDEARRLALLLENASLEARATGRSMAWTGKNNHYLFWRKNDYGDWLRIDDDSSFRPRNMPEGMSIGSVFVADNLLKPDEYLALNAHSFAPPFRIELSYHTTQFNVVGKSTGEVMVQSNNEKQSANVSP